MNKYTCNGYRPVKADTMREAAAIFAARMARKFYPKWSDVATVAEDYACEITASEHTAPANIRLMEVFEWAKEMAKA